MIDHIRLGDTIPGLYPSYYTLKDIQEERRLANPRLRRREIWVYYSPDELAAKGER